MHPTINLFFALPIFVSARIDIAIKIPHGRENASVTFAGENVDRITVYEKKTFGIVGKSFKNAIELLSGRYPDVCFYNSPTPWGDLYTRFKWEPINRTLKPYEAKIISLKKTKTLLRKESFANNNKNPTPYIAEIHEELDSDFLSVWNKSDLNPGEQIQYSIDFGEDENGEVYFKFLSFFGENNRKLKPTTIGTKSAVNIELPEEEAVETYLYAYQWTMEIEVLYTAFLDGDLACNFDPPLHGHHFWKFDINNILVTMNSPQTRESIERIRIIFYSDPFVVVKDAKTQEVLFKDTVDIDYCLSTVRGVGGPSSS